MYKDKTISVIVPAFNEEEQVGKVIETIPSFVDTIVVIDDRSTDNTVSVVNRYREKMGDKLILIQHEKNQGVGGTIATGYKWARDNHLDVAVVMAGDGQMAPGDLPAILDPVVDDSVDYTKGNRLFTKEAFQKIPKVRYFGNAILSFFTKIASGYWHIADSQAGYTAINKKSLSLINWDEMYKRYGQPNDLLVRLNVHNLRVRDIEITPVYHVGEKSGIRIWKVIFTIGWLLLKRFFWRLKEKYIIQDFHPLVLFYFLAFFLLGASFILFIRVVWIWAKVGIIPSMNAMAWMFCGSLGLQSLFFAMWFDMEYNKNLK